MQKMMKAQRQIKKNRKMAKIRATGRMLRPILVYPLLWQLRHFTNMLWVGQLLMELAAVTCGCGATCTGV